MSIWMGYLTRSTGIVATILVVAALLWGFFFSSRTTGTRLRPAWWLDLHNWLGGLALIFCGLHILAAWLDTSSGIGLIQILVPGTAVQAWPIAWGVIATYGLVVVVFTSWPRRLRRRLWWRIIHLTSVAATAFIFLHAYQTGSDVGNLAFRVGFIAAAWLASYGVGVRVFTIADGRTSKV
ncbi:MAG: ferric reductase-like transmembrane domain-containing protein [Acidimicrobiia bacterium]|nr:ferric reductase-like transmembrane domain-containing protein [Acidimicrobiia bacterium]